MPVRGVLCVAAMAYLGVASVEATKTRWHVRTSARFASAPPGSSSPADSSHAPVTIAGSFALHVAHALRTNSSSAPARHATRSLRRLCVTRVLRRRLCVVATRPVAMQSCRSRTASSLVWRITRRCGSMSFLRLVRKQCLTSTLAAKWSGRRVIARRAYTGVLSKRVFHS